MNIIGIAIIVLGIVGIIAAIVLYVVAKKFHVYEDPRIADVEEHLPGANCGSCGYSGCHAFAVACSQATSLDGLNCPGAGSESMAKIADILGLTAVAAVPQIAVVRCNGSCENREHYNRYDGVHSCSIEASLYAGETDCVYGCLGCGDCVSACPYDALHMNDETGLPVVDVEKCVGCGRCVDACPRGVMQLADDPGDHVPAFVACNNHDKGGVAMKECKVSCIGCTKCAKVCPTGAAKITAFLSDIDSSVCTGCGACIEACPRKCIAKIRPESVNTY